MRSLLIPVRNTCLAALTANWNSTSAQQQAEKVRPGQTCCSENMGSMSGKLANECQQNRRREKKSEIGDQQEKRRVQDLSFIIQHSVVPPAELGSGRRFSQGLWESPKEPYLPALLRQSPLHSIPTEHTSTLDWTQVFWTHYQVPLQSMLFTCSSSYVIKCVLPLILMASYHMRYAQ